jgi:hypothetical protein
MKPRHGLLAIFAFAALLLSACQGGESPTEPTLSATVEAASAASAAPAADASDGSVATNDDEPRARRFAARAAELSRDETGAAQAPADAAELARAVAAGNGNGNGRGNGGGNGNGGNGNGNGGGNGNGNGGNGGGNGHRGELRLEMQPNTWNTNYEVSQGTVTTLVRGGDVPKIDTGSVRLVGDGGGTVEPTRVQTAGGQLRAFFAKAEALASLDDPDPGEVHEVKLQLTVEGTAKELTADVRIVGRPTSDDPGDPSDPAGDVDVSVQPNAWNTNWSHANGTVSVVLRGDVADVALDSIVLVGSAGIEVQPTSVKRTGHHVRARFAMREAFASLDDPDPGETHEIKIELTDDGTATELTATIRIVGPSTDD